MEEGAFGLSNGMSYVPNMFFDTAQLIELCKVAASYGGIFTIHIRNVSPGDPRDKGLKEAIEIAKGARIPVEIFHLGASAQMEPDLFIRDVRLDIPDPGAAGLGAGRRFCSHCGATSKARHPLPHPGRNERPRFLNLEGGLGESGI
jgi:hypothetical protein